MVEISKPAYFDDFRCIASLCPDSCCKEWDVQVDAASAAMYRALPGNLGDRLRAVLKDQDGEVVMAQSDGRCPMWRQDGLCRIQAELGEGALCQVCRDYPRLTHDYGDFVELGLELSCPEAARLILNASGAPAVCLKRPGDAAPEYDSDAMEVLKTTRHHALKILPYGTAGEALASLLVFAYQAQEALDGGEWLLPQPEKLLAQAKSLARPGDLGGIFEFFLDLEILTPQWRQMLQAGRGAGDWTEQHRAMARYMVERYWLQAVSDYDLVGRVKLICVSCLLVKTLGGDPVHTAQLFSKEIENDVDNIDAILDGAYTSPALADVGLLGLLLSQ